MNSKLIKIGNSRGLRLPKKLIDKYKLDIGMELVEKDEGILIKSKSQDSKLSWEDTYKSMSEEKEDWSDLVNAIDDGL